ncbi:MAG: 50S ribosomal protein L25 [bacterium]|nr:50S ribosomal protein L25 [bacterium]
MGEASLAVELRTETGKGFARRLREQGRIPAVLYGRGKDSVSLSVDAKLLDRLIKTSHAGLNTLIDLEGVSEVTGRMVLVKELQRHPVAGTLAHADFLEIDTSAKIHVAVPIRLLGTPEGVKLGGILEHSMREIDLLCLATAIPDSIDIDVSEIEMGGSLHVSDLTLPEGIETSVDEQLPVAHVATPKAEEEEAVVEEEGEAGAEAADDAAASAAEGDGDAAKDD